MLDNAAGRACSTCVFASYLSGGEAPKYLCRRYALRGEWTWPVVLADDWCGEWIECEPETP